MNHYGRRFSVTLAVAMACLASTHAPTQGDGTYAGNNQYIEQPAQIASVELEEQQTQTAAQDRVHPDVRAKPRSKGYVAITLKPEIQKDATPQQQKAAIKKVQDKVLARMAAEEFKLVYRFKSTAMLVGHLKDAGLAELNEDPKVVSVAPSKIRADVFAKLQESDDGTVQVIVNLTRVTQGAPISDQRKAAVKQIQDRVLSTLTAKEFKAPVRFNQMVSHLAGHANSAGLAKLQAHPDVWAVGLPGISKPTTGSSVPLIVGLPRENETSGHVGNSSTQPLTTWADELPDIDTALERSSDGTVYVLITPSDSPEPVGGCQGLALSEKTFLEKVIVSVAPSELKDTYQLGAGEGFFARVTASAIANLDAYSGCIKVETSKVEPQVHEKLLTSPDEMVNVIILLRHVGNDALPLAKRDAIVKPVQNRVLKRLASAGFRPEWVFEGVEAITGRASRRALELLALDPDVVGVGYNAPLGSPGG